MPDPWKESVRSTGTLRVKCDDSMVGDWAAVVGDAITAFNAIGAQENLGVQLVAEAEAGNANVIVWNIDGVRATEFQGTTYQRNLPGTASAGRTSLYSISGRVQMAHVFLPATPGQYASTRALGRPVRMFIAFHELVHCCGLHNSDHGHLAFHGTPSVTRGQTGAEDRISVQSGGQYVHMPPVQISTETARNIRQNWAAP